MRNVTPVLVVGAGPTGLLAAISLRIWGVPVRIVDRLEKHRASSRALGCQARSMEIFAALGVVDDILALSETVRETVLHDGRSEIARLRWEPPQSPYPYTYVLPQAALEAVLLARLSSLGTDVEWGWSVEDVEEAAECIHVRGSNGRMIDAEWVIGCDGAHSVVRECSGIAFSGRATGQSFYLADMVLESDRRLVHPMSFMGPNGPLMLMPIPGPEVRWRMFVDVTDEGMHHEPADPISYTQQVLDGRGLGRGALTVIDVVWTSLYEVEVRQAHAYRKGSILIAGDAAHVFPPFGGQGMNTGLQDAFNLGWKLALVVQGVAADRLLDTYCDERRHVGRQVIADVEKRRQGFALRNPILRALRNLLYRALLASRTYRRRLAANLSQIELGYRGSSRLAPEKNEPEPRSGTRAPDAPLGATTAHALMRPDRFTVFAFDCLPASPPQTLAEIVTIVAVDDVGEAADLRRKWHVASPELLLIRPDGHIGLRVKADEPGRIWSYLEDMMR